MLSVSMHPCIHASVHPCIHLIHSMSASYTYMSSQLPYHFISNYIYSLYPTASDIASYTIETPPLPQGGVPLGRSHPILTSTACTSKGTAGSKCRPRPSRCPLPSQVILVLVHLQVMLVLLVSFFRHSLGLDAVTCTWDVHPGLSSRIFVKQCQTYSFCQAGTHQQSTHLVPPKPAQQWLSVQASGRHWSFPQPRLEARVVRRWQRAAKVMTPSKPLSLNSIYCRLAAGQSHFWKEACKHCTWRWTSASPCAILEQQSRYI